MRIILFEWSFFGGDAEGTARHHVKHLQEFIHREKIHSEEQDVKKIEDELWLAMMKLSEADARKIKDVLKPHRAYVVS